MGQFHVATISPTKEALVGDWVPRQPWGPGADADVACIGSYRFDDPEGKVGIEVFLAAAGDLLFQVPLTYREAPLEEADPALITTMEHSVLGTRWVYDGLSDQRCLTMLAAGAMTGQGEALGMAEFEGRWYIAPSKVRIQGGGWTTRRVPLDGFSRVGRDALTETFANDGFDLVVHRRPMVASRPPIALTATWPDHPEPVLLVEVRAHPE